MENGRHKSTFVLSEYRALQMGSFTYYIVCICKFFCKFRWQVGGSACPRWEDVPRLRAVPDR